MEAQRSAGLPRVKRKGLSGRFLAGNVLVLLLFRADFSARSSFRIESTRISQMRCFVPVFLLSYSRLRNSPSTWICAPFFRVPANSESLPKTTQRCHSVCEMYLPSLSCRRTWLPARGW